MAKEPEWLQAVVREGQVRAGLVLYGNSRDLFPTNDATYATLPTLLWNCNTDYTIRAVWDRVDGLRFANQKERDRWTKVVTGSIVGGKTATTSYDLGEEEDEPPCTQGERIELTELIARYRRVLQAQGERPLLVIDWSHLLVTQAAHPAPDEREWLLQVGKALVGEPSPRGYGDHPNRSRGLLVLLAASLGAVPPVLYQGEARVRLMSVPSPSREERRTFFERHADDLRVETPRAAPGALPVPERKAKIEALADLTDQLTTADLLQVLTLSRTTKAPLPPDRLLNLYRFGDQRSPWEELSEEKLSQVHTLLQKRVIGQNAAVEHVSTMLIRAWLGLAGLQHSARRTKPKGTLFFVGPTGVGKTELAKACAEFLFGDEASCIRFDMSEYNHEHSDQRLVGAPPGYVGFEEGGQLTNAVAKRPFSVLLFDEIEKAHPRVLDKFLQILEDGRLTDGRGETSWFSETVIIFTSNIGASDAPADGKTGDYERHFQAAVESHFMQKLQRPELLNRLGDNVVVFQPIRDKKGREDILLRKLQPLQAHVRDRWGVELKIDPDVLGRLVEAARTDHGGRGLLNAVERDLVNPLAIFLFENHAKLRRGRVIEVTVEGRLLDFDLQDA